VLAVYIKKLIQYNGVYTALYSYEAEQQLIISVIRLNGKRHSTERKAQERKEKQSEGNKRK